MHLSIFRAVLPCSLLASIVLSGVVLDAQTAPAASPQTQADMPLFPHPDPRIAQMEAAQQSGKSLTHIGAVELAPDGKEIAWTLHERGTQVLHISPAGNVQRNDNVVTAGPGCSTESPRWSPDGGSLAFIASCTAPGSAAANAKAQIYLRDSKTGGVREVSHLNGAVTDPAWSPDGKRIGFLYVENATRSAGALAAMKPPAGVIGEDGVETQWVAAVDASSGSLDILSPKSLHAYEFDWSPDSQRILFTGANPPGENTWWIAQMYTVTVGQPESAKSILNPQTVAGPLHGLQIAVPRYSTDGRNIAFIGGLMSDQGATGGDIYLMTADGSGLQNLTADRKSSPAYVQWADADHLVFSEYSGGKSHIGLLGTNGKELFSGWTAEQSIENGRAALSFSVAPNARKIAFASSGPSQAPEIFAGDPRNFRAVSRLNADTKAPAAKTVSVEWQSDDFRVQGWLTLPANYDPAKKYPMIVNVHGGPSSVVGPSYAARGGIDLFSGLGYFIFQPNPRGSYGQGEAFTAANRKDFGYGDLRDILKGVDAVEAKYSIDDHRLGLTGWSYGGFMTMFAVTQTQRFHAAVAGAGISNWLSYYGENSIDQWMVPFFGATVYDDPAVYAKSSAISYIKNVKTPTLVIVGDRDGECPAPQSYEFWHALRGEGVKTQLVIYPNEGHRFSNPVHESDRTARMVAWFEDNLK